MASLRFVLLAGTGMLLLAGDSRPEPAAPGRSWVEPMRNVHARFRGTPSTFACFGDSITVTMAFWSPLADAPKDMPPDMAKALVLVKRYQRPECWRRWKGPEYGNTGSMTIRWAHDNVETWLKKLRPEVAVILFGTNDIGQLTLQEHEKKTGEVVDRCLARGTVVLLTTPPPRGGHVEQSRQFAEAVRRVARQKQVPLIDYQAEILKRRPDDWDGSLPKFKSAPGDEYQVPTLIARDGVHPSNPRQYQGYSEEALRHNGYALRNYLTLLAYAEVIREVLLPDGTPGKERPAPAKGAAARAPR
jgi:hypothetical protein